MCVYIYIKKKTLILWSQLLLYPKTKLKFFFVPYWKQSPCSIPPKIFSIYYWYSCGNGGARGGMTTITTTTASMSSALGNPFGGLHYRPCGRRRTTRLRIKPPRVALVEARPPRPPVPVINRDGAITTTTTTDRDDNNNYSHNINGSVVTAQQVSVPSGRDRTEDMQAEARAMARAANASIYSPQLLSTKYGSRPIKVIPKQWLRCKSSACQLHPIPIDNKYPYL